LHHRRGVVECVRLAACRPRCSTSPRRSTRSRSATRASSRATTSTPRSPACAPSHRAHLARLEIRIALEELYARFPHLTVAAEPERVAMRQIIGIKHLPVATDAR
jgi:hypothetical protein